MRHKAEGLSTAGSGSDPNLNVTYGELVAFMEQAIGKQHLAQGDDPGLTTMEWANEWRINERNARRKIQALFNQGLIVVGRRSSIGMDGRRIRVPVYRAKTDGQSN